MKLKFLYEDGVFSKVPEIEKQKFLSTHDLELCSHELANAIKILRFAKHKLDTTTQQKTMLEDGECVVVVDLVESVENHLKKVKDKLGTK